MVRKLRDHPSKSYDADGFKNRAKAFFLSRFKWFWDFIQAVPFLKRWANDLIINNAVMVARTRPSPYGSMAVQGDSSKPMAGYVSWEMMMDKEWFKRHLPQSTLGQPGDKRGDLPDLSAMAELYKLPAEGPVLSEDSSVLFLSFAQWFTDGFLMTDAADRRKTHTSHHIDFNPLYGLTRAESDAIRLRSEEVGKRGLLKTEIDPETGEVFAPKYFDEDGNVKSEFAALRPPLGLPAFLDRVTPKRAAEIKPTIFAFAGERANTTAFTAMLNTLFLREHNRIAGLIEAAHPDWDDERVFQTARNVNVVLLIKIVVEEYINHISPYHFQLTADPSVCWHKKWNKPNWIPIEFNLLYRWHSLTPEVFEVNGTNVPGPEILFDNSHVTKIGLGKAMASASAQRACNIGLQNTPEFLLEVELASVAQGRENKLGSYNDYRKAMGYPPVTRFDQITGDPKRIELLKRLYDNNVNKIEYFVGLFAEDVPEKSAVPSLIGRMVALDAFGLALTNPLMSEHAFNPRTFSKAGWKVLQKTNRLQQILDRNLGPDTGKYKVTMTLPTQS